MMNRSKIKTWFKRNGYKVKYGAFRKEWQYCYKGLRNYRVRNNTLNGEWVVDTGDLNFDRWANSTEIYAQPITEFIKNGGVVQNIPTSKEIKSGARNWKNN